MGGCDPSGERPLPTDPLLAVLIEQSLAARPELAQARASALANRERVPQAGALPDPVLQLGVQNDGFTSWQVGRMESSWYSVMASQTFPWPGTLRLRSEAAELGASQTDQRVARVRLSTEAEVRRAYLSLVLARDRLVLLNRLEATWQKSADLARTRYEAGQGAQSESPARAARDQPRQAAPTSLQAEAETEVQTLNRLRGRALGEPIVAPTHLVDLALPGLGEDSTATQDGLDRSPELAAARLGVVQAEAVREARPKELPAGPHRQRRRDATRRRLPADVALERRRSSSRLCELQAEPQGRGRRSPRRRQPAGRREPGASGSPSDRTAPHRARRDARNDSPLQRQPAHPVGSTAESTLAQYAVGKITFAAVLEATAGFIADQDGYLQALAQAHRLEIDALDVSLSPVSLSDGASSAASLQSGAAPDAAGAASSSMSSL